MKSLSARLQSAPLVVCLCVATCIPAAAQVNVTTYHNDNSRTGQNTQETTLTTANVTPSTFGPLFSVSVDGQVYAQPLVLSNVSIGGGTHNVVYVATENDSVYAIDANNGAVYWRTSLGTPVPYEGMPGLCQNVTPVYGVTSTPTIDTSNGTNNAVLYVVAQNGFSYQLHALDVKTGADIEGPATVGGSFNGITFSPFSQLIRPGLLLENGHIIIAAGSHCDTSPWYGWVFSYSASTLVQEGIFNVDPNGSTGIWMSGNGVAADGSGNLYFSTGNGPEQYKGFGNSILKLSPPTPSGFSVLDYFAPSAGDLLGNEDNDVGAGGVLLIPGTSQLVGMGKDGVLYLVNTGNMGKYCGYSNCVDNIAQEIWGQNVGVWGSPAFWNGHLYYGSAHEGGPTGPVEVFSYNAGLLSTTPTSVTPEHFSWPTPTPSVSANGTSNGIVWVLDNGALTPSCCQALHAYNASNLNNELYAISLPFGGIKFSVPTVANGEVFVGSGNALTAFGLTSGPANTVTPTSLTLKQGNNCTSGPTAVTLKNTGSVWMNISSVILDNNGGFSIAQDNCTGGGLNPGQSCAVDITYTGGTSNTSTLEFNDSGANTPQLVNLTGITQRFTCQ